MVKIIRRSWRGMVAVLCLCAMTPAATGQTFFSRLAPPFVEETSPSFSSLLRAPNGSWYLIAARLNGDNEGNSLVKLDADGDEVFTKRVMVGTSLPWRMQCMAVTSNNSVVAALNDTLEQISPGHVVVHFRLVKFSSSGSITWSKRVTMDLNDTVYNARPTAIALDDQGIFVSGFDDHLPFIFRFDTNGNLDWAKRLSDPVNEIGPPTRLVADGSGGCYFMADGPYYPDPPNVVVGRFSASGSLSWCRHFDHGSPDISWRGSQLVLRSSGNLLLTAAAYTTGTENAGLIAELTPSGYVNWVKKYLPAVGFPHLTPYGAQEVQGDHILLDWQDGGFGFTELTASGDVLTSPIIRYRSGAWGLHVVGWNSWTTYDNELSIPIWYLIDDGDYPYPTAAGLMNLDLNSISFCPGDTTTVAATTIPNADVEVLNTVSATTVSATVASASVVVSNEAFLSFEELCSHYLDVPDHPAAESALVNTNLVQQGTPVIVSCGNATRIDVYDASGARVLSRTAAPQLSQVELRTADWSPGLFIVVASGSTDQPPRTARIIVQ